MPEPSPNAVASPSTNARAHPMPAQATPTNEETQVAFTPDAVAHLLDVLARLIARRAWSDRG